jgi:ElaB/YqjD/DUF883 family membrane-anchored ribosome-binding protein
MSFIQTVEDEVKSIVEKIESFFHSKTADEIKADLEAEVKKIEDAAQAKITALRAKIQPVIDAKLAEVKTAVANTAADAVKSAIEKS